MKNYYIPLILIAVGLKFGYVQANILKDWYVSGAVGYNIPLKNDTQGVQTFNVVPPPPDRYTATKDTGDFFSSIEVGRVLHLQASYLHKLAVGLAIQSGGFKEDGDIVSLGHHYGYKGKAKFISVLALLYLPIIQAIRYQIEVSVLLGVGPSYNSASDYSEYQTEDTSPRIITIPDDSQWDIAYMVGLSLSKKFTPHLKTSIRYEYLDAGTAVYGKVFTNQKDGDGPKLKLKNQVLLLGLQYNF